MFHVKHAQGLDAKTSLLVFIAKPQGVACEACQPIPSVAAESLLTDMTEAKSVVHAVCQHLQTKCQHF